MDIYSMYFSPTGGTKKVMEFCCEEWEVNKEIDLTAAEYDYSNYNFKKEDICFVGVPSYGGRVPAVALERMKKMHGNGASAVLIAVYGNRAYEDTLLELRNELSDLGFQIRAAIAAVAEHSIMRQFASGRPDLQDKEQLQKFSKEIKEVWEKKESSKKLFVPGDQPYRVYHGVPFKPHSGKKCNICGLCAKKCPVQAIPKESPNLTDESKCISCMRCITICPQHSRKVNKILFLAASQKMKKLCSSRKENELFL